MRGWVFLQEFAGVSYVQHKLHPNPSDFGSRLIVDTPTFQYYCPKRKSPDSDRYMSMPNANFMTIVEASAKLGKSPKTIHRWLEEGRLPGHKVEVDGHDRWVVDIDKVNAITKPPDARAELNDLREEVAWLKERLEAKARQADVIVTTSQPAHARSDSLDLREQLRAKDEEIRELRLLLSQYTQIPEHRVILKQQRGHLPEPNKRPW